MTDAPTPATADEKPWWQSKTVLGSIVAVLASIAGIFHFSVDASLQMRIVDVVAALGGILGSIIAIIGRFTASATLK